MKTENDENRTLCLDMPCSDPQSVPSQPSAGDPVSQGLCARCAQAPQLAPELFQNSNGAALATRTEHPAGISQGQQPHAPPAGANVASGAGTAASHDLQCFAGLDLVYFRNTAHRHVLAFQNHLLVDTIACGQSRAPPAPAASAFLKDVKILRYGEFRRSVWWRVLTRGRACLP